ncbi:phosphotransferase [Streptomyces sp. NPDC005727]|uniref:phosphotransferase n=1 Tax=unclassified Streptomyces TaxID=2593676 RepID=UPI0033CD2F8A
MTVTESSVPLSEEEVVRWAAGVKVSPGASLSPQVAAAGSGRPVLTEVPGPRFDARVRDGSVTDHHLRYVGRALAVLHAADPPGDSPVVLESLPWEPLPLRVWAGLTGAQRQLTGTLHREEVLRNRGRTVQADLTAGDVWCHGDARTNNIVVAGDTPMFIDWECSGLGRPEADLGSLCGSLMFDELNPMDAPAGAEAQAELRASLGRATGHIRVVLAAYRSHSDRRLDPALLGGAVGGSLLSRALMRASQTRLDRVVTVLAGIGRGLLLDPARWRAIDAHA